MFNQRNRAILLCVHLAFDMVANIHPKITFNEPTQVELREYNIFNIHWIMH